MSPEFTPWLSTVGGALIGASASAMLLLEGRVAGISGIVGGLFTPKAGDIGWRLDFVAGLVLAGIGGMLLAPESVAVEVQRAPWMLVCPVPLISHARRGGDPTPGAHIPSGATGSRA